MQKSEAAAVFHARTPTILGFLSEQGRGPGPGRGRGEGWGGSGSGMPTTLRGFAVSEDNKIPETKEKAEPVKQGNGSVPSNVNAPAPVSVPVPAPGPVPVPATSPVPVPAPGPLPVQTLALVPVPAPAPAQREGTAQQVAPAQRGALEGRGGAPAAEISEEEDDEPHFFLTCKPSMRKKPLDKKTEEKDKEDALKPKEQQTELTGKAVDDLMTRVKVGYLH